MPLILDPSSPISGVTSRSARLLDSGVAAADKAACWFKASNNKIYHTKWNVVYDGNTAVKTFTTYGSSEQHCFAYLNWVYCASISSVSYLISGWPTVRFYFKIEAYNVVSGSSVLLADINTNVSCGASGPPGMLIDAANSTWGDFTAGCKCYGSPDPVVAASYVRGVIYVGGYRAWTAHLFASPYTVYTGLASAEDAHAIRLGLNNSDPVYIGELTDLGGEYNKVMDDSTGYPFKVYCSNGELSVHNDIGFISKTETNVLGVGAFSISTTYKRYKITSITTRAYTALTDGAAATYTLGPGLHIADGATSMKSYDEALSWTLPAGIYRFFLGEDASYWYILGYAGPSAKTANIYGLLKTGTTVVTYDVDFPGDGSGMSDKNWGRQGYDETVPGFPSYIFGQGGWYEVSVPTRSID